MKGGTRKGSGLAREEIPGPCSCSKGAKCVPKIVCVLAAFIGMKPVVQLLK